MTAVSRRKGQQVQPGLAGAAAGRLDVQDVRADGGDRRGIDPDSTSYMSAPFKYSPDLRLERAAAVVSETYATSYLGSLSITTRDALLRQRGLCAADPRRRPRERARDGAPARRPLNLKTREGNHVPSLGLGAADVSPLEMASAYATLAAGGIYSQPMAIRKVVLANGKEDKDAGWGKPKRKRVLTDGVAYEVTRILEQNIDAGTGTERGFFGRPAAGKTGTTDKHTDAWFCGYTPNLSATVWVGLPAGADADGERPRDPGRRRHLPGRSIWDMFMRSAIVYSPPRSTSRSRRRSRPGCLRARPVRRTTRTTTTTTTTTTTRPRGAKRKSRRRRPPAASSADDDAARPGRPLTLSRALRAAAVAAPVYLLASAHPCREGSSASGGFVTSASTATTPSRCSTDASPTATSSSSTRRAAFSSSLRRRSCRTAGTCTRSRCSWPLVGLATLVVVGLILARLGASPAALYAGVLAVAAAPLVIGPVSLNTSTPSRLCSSPPALAALALAPRLAALALLGRRLRGEALRRGARAARRGLARGERSRRSPAAGGVRRRRAGPGRPLRAARLGRRSSRAARSGRAGLQIESLGAAVLLGRAPAGHLRRRGRPRLDGRAHPRPGRRAARRARARDRSRRSARRVALALLLFLASPLERGAADLATRRDPGRLPRLRPVHLAAVPRLARPDRPLVGGVAGVAGDRASRRGCSSPAGCGSSTTGEVFALRGSRAGSSSFATCCSARSTSVLLRKMIPSSSKTFDQEPERSSSRERYRGRRADPSACRGRRRASGRPRSTRSRRQREAVDRRRSERWPPRPFVLETGGVRRDQGDSALGDRGRAPSAARERARRLRSGADQRSPPSSENARIATASLPAPNEL